MKYFIIFSIAVLILFLASVHQHELVHQKIFTSQGIESKVNLFSTTPNNNTFDRTLHIQNDIVHYNIVGLFAILYIGLAIIILKIKK